MTLKERITSFMNLQILCVENGLLVVAEAGRFKIEDEISRQKHHFSADLGSFGNVKSGRLYKVIHILLD